MWAYVNFNIFRKRRLIGSLELASFDRTTIDNKPNKNWPSDTPNPTIWQREGLSKLKFSGKIKCLTQLDGAMMIKGL